MKYKKTTFCFLFVFIFLFLPFSKVMAVAGEGYCVCATNCTPYSYKDDTELTNAKAACKVAPCNSKYAFKENAKCSVPSKVSCQCIAGCKDNTYDNSQINLDKINAECKACGGTEYIGSVCPAAITTPATPVSPTKKEPNVVSLENPLGIGKTVPAILGAIIKGALGIMGGLVLLMVVWGGTTWITAAGSPEKIKAGSQTILWALLGAILTVGSYVILSGIINAYF